MKKFSKKKEDEPKPCGSCRGSGACTSCGGTGEIYLGPGTFYQDTTCTSCRGTGNCSSCNGTGAV
jgi:molecular chaperone DnaJ